MKLIAQLTVCLFLLILPGLASADTCPSQLPAPGWSLVGAKPTLPLDKSFISAELVPGAVYCAYQANEIPGYAILISPLRYGINDEADWSKDYKMAAFFCRKSIYECTFHIK